MKICKCEDCKYASREPFYKKQYIKCEREHRVKFKNEFCEYGTPKIFKEKTMNESQIKMLENALKLYYKAIQITKEYDSDFEKENEFYFMVKVLSKEIGVELKY